MAYVATGFPRGRPRKGEIRPLTPGGVAQAEWRRKQLTLDTEGYRALLANYQRLWHLANPGSKKQSQTKYLQREASFANNTGAYRVTMP